MPSRADDLPEGTAARADATFVTHATWAPLRTAGMLARVAPDLVLADSGLSCDTFNIVCRARLAGAGGMQRCRDAVAHFTVRAVPSPGGSDRPTSPKASAPCSRRSDSSARRPSSPWPCGSTSCRVGTPRCLGWRSAGCGRLRSWNHGPRSCLQLDPPDAGVLSFYRLTAPALLDPDAPQWLYLGLLDGAAVATAEATAAAAPRRRGRGMQPRRVQAAAAGVGVYRRLGFATFGEITEYKPKGGSP